MAPSIRSKQEEPDRQNLVETSRSSSSNTSGKTTSARSSLSDGKEKQTKRVSFRGLSPSSASEDETSSICRHVDIVTRKCNKYAPVCRRACLANKDVLAALNVVGSSIPRELPGKLNKDLSVALANIVQLNVRDRTNVRRNNEQESSRSQVQPAAEKSVHNQVQPKPKTQVSFQDLYRHMSASGPYQSRSTEISQQVVNIRDKPQGQLTLPRTHKNTHGRLSQSPIPTTGSNCLGAVKNLDEHQTKQNRSRRRTNLPASVHSGKRCHKRTVSNMVQHTFELTAFSGNETPSNHTDDFQQYIQHTRSELHPFDAERIRQDGSSVDPVISNKRTLSHSGLLTNTTPRHLIESAPEIHTDAKDTHSSFNVHPTQEKHKAKKKRGTRKLDTRQQTGSVREKRSHVEDKPSMEAATRLYQTDTSILERHQTDAISRLTATKLLQYRILLGNKHALDGVTHSTILDPPKITNVEGNLQKKIKDFKSSRIRSPGQSIVSGSRLKHSVRHKKAAPNQIVEANKQTDVDRGNEVTAKQTKQKRKSADFYPVNSLPTFATQRRNAAYMAYAKTGRRAKLLGDAIQLVQYNRDSPKRRASGIKSGFSEGASVHKLKSGTAKSKVKVHSTKDSKPTLKRHGRLEKRCFRSGATSRNKKQDRGEPVSNVTENSSTGQRHIRTIRKRKTLENSSTGQRHIKTIRKRKTPVSSRVTKQSTSQQPKKTRKPRSRISRGPKHKCRPTTVPCRQKPPTASVNSGSGAVTSHRGGRSNKSKCRKKSSKDKGNISHNARHSTIRTSKCEPTKEAHRTNAHDVLSNSKCKTNAHDVLSNRKCKTNNFTLKRCGLRKPPKAKEKCRKRRKPRRLQRCRCTEKKMEYFNRCNQATDIKEDMCGMRMREAKPCENVALTRGANLVSLWGNRPLSPETCINAQGSIEDDSSPSDASGGLSGMSRSKMRGLSRPTLSTESMCPLNSWQKLLITEDVSSPNKSNTTNNCRSRGGQRKVGRRQGREVSALLRKSTLKVTDDEKFLHKSVVQLIY